MRNLKRVLSLALALVMVLGVMVMTGFAAGDGTGGNAGGDTSAAGGNAGTDGYADADDISDEYVEAVEVMTGIGVIQGDGVNLNPQEPLVREEAAKIVTYLVLGADAAEQVQTAASSFTDVEDGRWSAGFVSYCANVGMIAGYGDGTFGPRDELTGVAFAKLLLVALGYDADVQGYVNVGPTEWIKNVVIDAVAAGIVPEDVTLTAQLNREQAIQMAFLALQADTVEYKSKGIEVIASDGTVIRTGVIGPYPVAAKANATDFDATSTDTDKTVQLVEKLYPTLTKVNYAPTTGAWGRPEGGTGYKWNLGSKNVSTIETKPQEKATATFTVKTSECEIATALDKSGKFNLDVYDNNVLTEDVEFNATKTAKTLGAQGTLIEVYQDRVVIIDTYLAKVTKVNEAKYDTAGHEISKATTDLQIWGLTIGEETITKGSIDGNNYAAGTYLLVYYNAKDAKLVAVQEAESFRASQDKVWVNADKHTIDGVDYPNAVHYALDEARFADIDYTWFKDLYGNLIGSVEIDRTSYAVLKDIVWKIGAPGYAEATLVDANGDEYTAVVDQFDGLWIDADRWPIANDWDTTDGNNREPRLDDQARTSFPGVSSDTKFNGYYEGYALYQVTTNDNGTVDLDGFDYVLNQKNEQTLATFVGYDNDVILDTNSSVILDLRPGTVYVTADTQFLVREGTAGNYTYVPYTRDNVPEFAQNTEIFYTSHKDDNGNTIADIVYVKNGVIEAELGDHLFVPANVQWGRVSGDLNTWEIDVVIDGVERTVATNYEIAKYLAANEGKLFHVEWELNPDRGYYGFVGGVYLVNEAVDNDGCDYLSNYTVVDGKPVYDITYTGKTIISDGRSYTVDDDTVIIGNGGKIDTTKGIWVVTDDFKTTHAAVVYVGTRLSNVTTPTVDGKYITKDEKGQNILDKDNNPVTAIVPATVSKDGKTYTVTLPLGYTSAEVRAVGDNMNTVIVPLDSDGDQDGAAKIGVWSESKGADSQRDITVWAEDGVTKATYTIKLVQEKPTVIEDAVAYIRNGMKNAVLATGVDVYYDIETAAANAIALTNDKHYVNATLEIDTTLLTNGTFEVVRFTSSTPVTQDGFDAATASTVTISGGVSGDIQINDLDAGTIVVVELNDRASTPVYLAFSVNN